MKKYEVVLFDLDGTIVDSGEGVTNSVAHALKKYGIEVCNREELYKFIGPPLHESFENFYGFTKEEAMKAVDYYREYYTEKGIYENFVYDGIENLLKTLAEREKIICLATSKPEEFAVKILDYFNLTQYFNYIAGANMDGTRTGKEEVIEYLLSRFETLNNSEVIMVGDRKYDILGAKEFGIDSVGVLFGYGTRNELEGSGATYIAETAEEIDDFIL